MNWIAYIILHLLLSFFFPSTRGSVQSQGLTYDMPGSTIELQPPINTIFVRFIECGYKLLILLAVEHSTVGVGYGQSVPSTVSGHSGSVVVSCM